MQQTLRPGIRHQHKYKVPPSKTVPALYPESEEPIPGARVSSDSIRCVQRSDRSTTTSLNWSTGAMSV
jgi:hypothetical protein